MITPRIGLCKQFLPENDMYLQITCVSVGGISGGSTVAE